MYIYLASPIDFADDPWRADGVRTELIAAGHAVFAPYRAWGARGPLDARLQDINMTVLQEVDALVAFLPANVPTVGTLLELQWAVDHGIPAGVITELDISKSASLLWLDQHPNVVVSNSANYVAGKLQQLNAKPKQIALWDGEGVAPKIGKPGDAGFDLFYTDDMPLTIAPGEFQNVRSKIAVEMPAGTWGLIVGRSSTFKRRLFVAPSVIDNGYRGELFACCWNIGTEPQVIEPGDRLAQLVPFPLTAENMTWLKGALSTSERGNTGFGSTGR